MIHYQVMSGGRLRSKMNKEGLERFFTCGYTDSQQETMFMLQLVSAINSGAVHVLDTGVCNLGDFRWMNVDAVDDDYVYVVDVSIFTDDEEFE